MRRAYASDPKRITSLSIGGVYDIDIDGRPAEILELCFQAQCGSVVVVFLHCGFPKLTSQAPYILVRTSCLFRLDGARQMSESDTFCTRDHLQN